MLLGNVNMKSSMAYRPVSFPITSSDLERQDAKKQFSQADLRNNATTVSHRTTKFDRITHVGRGVFLGVTRTPLLQGGLAQVFPISGFLSKFDVTTGTGRGAGSQHFTILGFLLFMRTPFVTELPNLTW